MSDKPTKIDEITLRPDILYTISEEKKINEEEYDLEQEQDGFHCHNCNWRSLSLPMNSFSENVFDAVCPECGEEGVENKLGTHVEEIEEIFENSPADETEFMPYSYYKENFSGPQDRLDEALNHISTNGNSFVVFSDGEAQINIQA